MPSQRLPTSWRNRLRISVRAMMILVLVLGAALAWLERRASVQREAVAAIQKSGGRVRYEWERKNDNPVPNGRPGWPSWLVDRVGIDYFGNVVFVELSEKGSDAEMVHIGRLRRLEELYLYVSGASHNPVSRLTDAGMVHIAGLKLLRRMVLSSNRVGDTGLAHLKELIGLKLLTITVTQATPDGVAALQKSLPELQLTWYGCTTPCSTLDCR
jgi:internalin A